MHALCMTGGREVKFPVSKENKPFPAAFSTKEPNCLLLFLRVYRHKMVNTKMRLIIVFSAKDGEALYSQQKQDEELIVAQTMNSLLPNSDLN